ncbi:MAG: NBR1-Ig-like domain-containing protein [Chloroflexota bacterium]
MRTPPSLLAFVLIAILLAGCAPAAQPTTDPSQVRDMVSTSVAQTLAAGQTAQAAQASNTPLPTNTTEPTPTPLPTNTPAIPTLVVVPTATNTPFVPAGGGPAPTPSPYQCQWVKQKPADWTVFKPGVDFDMVWTVKNTGTKNWEPTDIDLMYLRGQKMQTFFDLIDLPALVKPGQTIDLLVDMIAPKQPGHYSATWTLKGAHEFCTLTISITVAE